MSYPESRNLPNAKQMSFSAQFLHEASEILNRLDTAVIDRAVALLADTRRRKGRLFILGVGGSAANASHAVNDFRKIAGIEAYAPTDNVSELTARTNDEGWASIFENWLRVSQLSPSDTILGFSPLAAAILKNKSAQTSSRPCNSALNKLAVKSIGIVRAGRRIHRNRGLDACVLIPTVRSERT